jgi:HTH-type transcriptional regulator / antitoxin HigA
LVRYESNRALRSAKDYRRAIAEIDLLLDRVSVRGTQAHDRLELLSVLVEAYENEHDPIDESGTPQEVVDFVLEQRGMTRVQLAPLLGGRSRVTAFFGDRRPLSLAQIKNLRSALGIPFGSTDRLEPVRRSGP